MKRLTKRQVVKALQENDYILIRTAAFGIIYGVNCKVLNFKNNIESTKDDKLDEETCYESFKPCSLNEYISHKMPFDR
ncbi:MAG: hypothetical protein WAW57_15305 [Lutibacter sp.]